MPYFTCDFTAQCWIFTYTKNLNYFKKNLAIINFMIGLYKQEVCTNVTDRL